MELQKIYWNEMAQLKFEIFYLNEYLSSSYKKDKVITFFLAITSGSGIGGWLIKQDYKLIWAIMLGISSILMTIKHDLPYNNWVKSINNYLPHLNKLFYQIEHEWLSISDGSLTITEINDALFSLRSSKEKLHNTYFNNQILLENKKIIKLADIQTENYFKIYLSRMEDWNGKAKAKTE